MKPMLACDWDPERIVWPKIMQPKIDGVRGLNINGNFSGRSLKASSCRNNYTRAVFGIPQLSNLDGELAAERDTHPSLCRLTTSAVQSFMGEPFVLWWLFDDFSPENLELPYLARYQVLRHRYQTLVNDSCNRNIPGIERIRLVPMRMVRDLQEAEDVDAEYLTAGYEGSILRDPNGKHKQGRSTIVEGGLLRIKRFVDGEAVVNSINEGRSNWNDPTQNPLGKTERSTHAENMHPNGLVGSMECTDCETGKDITVSAGEMDANERKLYFENPQLIVKKKIKYKHFPKGVKDLPRFPIFQCILD